MREVKVELSNEELRKLEEIAANYNWKINVQEVGQRAISQYIRIHRLHRMDRPVSNRLIKNRLKEILNQKKIKKGDFAKEIGISFATLSNIINHRSEPTLDIAMRISYQLGLNIFDIFYR